MRGLRRIGVPEDHLHVLSHLLELMSIQIGDIDTPKILVIEPHLAPGRFIGAHDDAPSGRLPATTSHQTQRLSWTDEEAHIIHRFDISHCLCGEKAPGDGEQAFRLLTSRRYCAGSRVWMLVIDSSSSRSCDAGCAPTAGKHLRHLPAQDSAGARDCRRTARPKC